MKLLFFYQHFWPDSPPYANMLRTISTHFALEGHDVSVLTAQPSYKVLDRLASSPSAELIENVNVRRLAVLPGSRTLSFLRLLSKATWPVRAASHLVAQAVAGRRQDVIVAATIPPVANGLFGLVAARLTRAKFVYHLQDIYPEIGAVGGLWSDTGIKHRLLRWLDTRVCKKADHCIVLSEDMKNTLKDRGVSAHSISVINNFMLASFSEAGLEAKQPLDTIKEATADFRIVFAGNLGRFQGLELMLEAFIEATRENNLPMELHFIGEGAAEQSLKQAAKSASNVHFHGHYPFEEACQLMATFDAGIVSIQPDIFRYAYPSKTLTYLGVGLPLLALVECESELAAFIGKEKLGVSSSNTSKQALIDGFIAITDYLASDANDSSRIKHLAENTLSSAAVMRRWDTLFEDLKYVQ